MSFPQDPRLPTRVAGLVIFRQTSVFYDREPRVAGSSKYNRLLGSPVIGPNSIVGFSRPLHLISVVEIVFSGSSFLLAVVYPRPQACWRFVSDGNPTIVIVVPFFSGIQPLSLAVMGEYVGRIYDEARQRPKFIIESRYGFDDRE